MIPSPHSQQSSEASAGRSTGRTYRRWRALTVTIAVAFLLLPVLFLLYLWAAGQGHPR